MRSCACKGELDGSSLDSRKGNEVPFDLRTVESMAAPARPITSKWYPRSKSGYSAGPFVSLDSRWPGTGQVVACAVSGPVRGGTDPGGTTGLLYGGVIHQLGDTLLGLRPAAKDSFDENRVGLDHLAFSVGSREALDDAAALLDHQGVAHTGVKDIGAGFILEFLDPDNPALELFAAEAWRMALRGLDR